MCIRDRPYNAVMANVALRAKADKIILGGMGLTNDDFLSVSYTHLYRTKVIIFGNRELSFPDILSYRSIFTYSE